MKISHLGQRQKPSKKYSKTSLKRPVETIANPERSAFKRKRTKSFFKVNPEKLTQSLSLLVFGVFGILFLPTVLAENGSTASAEEPKKVQVVTNFSDQTQATPNAPKSTLVEVGLETVVEEPIIVTSGLSSQSSSISNPTYTAVAGDTVSIVAQKLKLDPVELAVINSLKSNKIEVGTILTLPQAD